jgi:hypothetical protein
VPGEDELEALTGKSPDQIKSELLAMQQRNTARLEKAGQDIQSGDEAAAAALSGADLDYDVRTLITRGIIQKEGIQVLSNMKVDMHTLDKKERMLADIMVGMVYGQIDPTSNAYYQAIEPAMLAVAITKIKVKRGEEEHVETYEVPNFRDRNKLEYVERYKALMTNKLKLFDMLLDSSTELVTTLTLINQQLELADVLIGKEDAKKNSSAPGTPSESGSSAESSSSSPTTPA